MKPSIEPQIEETNIFDDLRFVLTSANRPNKGTSDSLFSLFFTYFFLNSVSQWNKREYRTKIEERGGVVIEDFSKLEPGARAFLIADTFYRTHKYLCALSLSVPCVNYKWIQECVAAVCIYDIFTFKINILE